MNKDRRNLLKIMLVGSGVVLLGKVLGPAFSRFMDDSPTKVNKAKPKADLAIDSGSFRMVENKKSLTVYDKSGEEIFQIDKGE